MYHILGNFTSFFIYISVNIVGIIIIIIIIMNFIKVSCLIAQAQCLTNWGDCKRPKLKTERELVQETIHFSNQGVTLLVRLLIVKTN